MTKKEFLEIIKDWDDNEEIVFKVTDEDIPGWPTYHYREPGEAHYESTNTNYKVEPFKGSEVPGTTKVYLIR